MMPLRKPEPVAVDTFDRVLVIAFVSSLWASLVAAIFTRWLVR